MKRNIFTLLLLAVSSFSFAQEIQTIFHHNSERASGGYGAITNKITRIGGNYANLTGIYGGWYINHKFLLGVSAAALTNDIRVPEKYNALPGQRMSYEYGEVGMVTEYVVGSHKAIHVAFNLFTGAGFTVQYQRYGLDDYDYDSQDNHHDDNWFFVLEPGAQVEINVTRWMRFSPGVSYRLTSGSEAIGLTDSDLRNVNYNLTLKFGKF